LAMIVGKFYVSTEWHTTIVCVKAKQFYDS
jgi:hypothetical protein